MDQDGNMWSPENFGQRHSRRQRAPFRNQRLHTPSILRAGCQIAPMRPLLFEEKTQCLPSSVGYFVWLCKGRVWKHRYVSQTPSSQNTRRSQHLHLPCMNHVIIGFRSLFWEYCLPAQWTVSTSDTMIISRLNTFTLLDNKYPAGSPHSITHI